VDDLHELMRALRRRVDAVTSVVRVAASRPDVDASIEQVRTELDVLQQRVDAAPREPAVVAELRSAVDVLGRRVTQIADIVVATTHATNGQLSALGAAQAATEKGIEEAAGALRALAERLEGIERDRRAIAADAARAEIVWAEERAALEARLDVLAEAMSGGADARPDDAALLEELTRRLERIEREREAAAEVAAAAEAWTTELAALEERLDGELASLAGRVDRAEARRDEPGAEIGDLVARIERLEHDRDLAGEELHRTAEAWAAERISLHERVAELAAGIVTGPAPDGSAETDSRELDRLRIGLEGMRMRLAYHEKTVGELARSSTVTDRLDELATRVDALQALVTAALADRTGGQLDVAELLEHVQTVQLSARTEQDSLLERFERIASRMDWRLQRLESPQAAVEH
jgi:chromosome segregation ATPase